MGDAAGPEDEDEDAAGPEASESTYAERTERLQVLIEYLQGELIAFGGKACCDDLKGADNLARIACLRAIRYAAAEGVKGELD